MKKWSQPKMEKLDVVSTKYKGGHGANSDQTGSQFFPGGGATNQIFPGPGSFPGGKKK